MKAFIIFFLGLEMSEGVIHSHGYIYTETSGIPGFPQFVSVGLVDGQQVSYFDTDSMKMVPRADWVSGAVDSDFWNRNGEISIATHQVFKNNIEVAKQRFNQTEGVHTVQLMYGCQWDDETEATDAFKQFGYDGEDFVSLDFKEFRWISPVPQGVPTVQKWNNDRGRIESENHYYSTVCIDWLKKYLEYGKSSLQKTAPPEVSVLQKSSSVSCHATGFYPSGVTITWKKNGEEHHEDVDLGQLLPNADGTFQKTSTLKVSSEELKNNKFSCEVEHQGETTSRSPADPFPMGMLLGVVGALVLCLIIAGVGILLWKKKSGFKPVSGSDDGSSNHSSPEATQA